MSHHNNIKGALKRPDGARPFSGTDVLIVGDFRQEEVQANLRIIVDKIKTLDYSPALVQKLGRVCAEIIDNISRHGLSRADATPYFSLAFGSNSVRISSGNIVSAAQRRLITQKFEAFFALANSGARTFSQSVPANGPGQSGGPVAAPGLLEIVQSCNKQVACYFGELAGGCYYFELSAVLTSDVGTTATSKNTVVNMLHGLTTPDALLRSANAVM